MNVRVRPVDTRDNASESSLFVQIKLRRHRMVRQQRQYEKCGKEDSSEHGREAYRGSGADGSVRFSVESRHSQGAPCPAVKLMFRTNDAIRRAGIAALLFVLAVVPMLGKVSGGAVVGESSEPKGKFIKLSIPLGNPYGPANSVGENTFQSPNLYAFDEDQNITLKKDLYTDVGLNPIPAGKVIASHYVFFDPGPSTEIVGVVDFNSRVIAIITSTGNLAASDFLANTGVNYLNPSERGLELEDYVSINGARQIMFHTVASSPGDYVRVLTEFSPQRITSLPPVDKKLLPVVMRLIWPDTDPR